MKLYNIDATLELKGGMCISVHFVCLKADFTLADFVEVIEKIRFDDQNVVSVEIINIEPVEVSNYVH